MKFLVFLITLVASCAWAAKNSVVVEKGKAVYKANCEVCHGEKYDGMGAAGQYLNPKPRNLVSDKFKNGDSAAAIFKTVTDGLKGTAMVGFSQLSASDRHAVAEFVHSLRKH